MSKWFDVSLKSHSDSGKTQILWVISKDGDRIGIIKWYAHWRQYCLSPEQGSIWNSECLDDVSHYIADLNEHHKTNPATNRNEKLATAFAADWPVFVPRGKNTLEEMIEDDEAWDGEIEE